MAGTRVPDKEMREFARVASVTLKNDGSYNIRRIAETFNISRATVKRRIDVIRDGLYPGITLGESDVISDPSDIQIAKLKDELRKTRKQLSDQTRENLDEEKIKIILNTLSEATEQPPDWIIQTDTRSKDPHVPVTMWADWHGGETIDPAEVNHINEFNTEVLERRVQRLIERTIHLCDNWGPGNYPGIIINLVGDFISGELHPELEKSDELARIPATLYMRDILCEALHEMADHFGKVFVPCVSGNHGRDTKRPEYKGYLKHNFDWLIYQLLIRHFADDDRITFMVPDSNECLYRVFSNRFLLAHGDMLGATGGDGIIGAIGPIMRGEFKTRGQQAAIGRDYDTLLIGHYHQELYLPQVRVANSLKGFDEYAKNKLRAKPSVPSQPLWFEHPVYRSVAYYNIQLEKPFKERPVSEWVTWKE